MRKKWFFFFKKSNTPQKNFNWFFYSNYFLYNVGNNIKREENMKYWHHLKKNQYLKNSWKIQTTFHQYQKLCSTPPWHGVRTCKVSRKYINAFWVTVRKTKRDGQTDGRTGGGGRCNISRPRAYGAAGDNYIHVHWMLKFQILEVYLGYKAYMYNVDSIVFPLCKYDTGRSLK